MARRKRKATTKPRAKGRTTVVVAKTRHHGKRRTTKRHAVRGTAVGATHHRKRRRKSSGSIMGFTTAGLKLKDGLMMVAGVGGAIVINHKLIRPMEAKLLDKHPGYAIGLGILHTGLGFAMAIKGKHLAVRAAGITFMGGGVNSLLRTTGIEKHIPGISGPSEDWTTVKIPMSGSGELKSMVAGLLTDNKPPKWPYVAGHNGYNDNSRTFSNSQSQRQNNQETFLTSQVGEVEEEYLMVAKG